MKKKGSQGYRVTECVILSRTVFVTISNCSDGVARTPGYQRVMSCRHNDGNGWIDGYDLVHMRTSKLGTAYLYVAWGPKHPTPEPTPVKYGVRTIKNGIVTDWTTFDDELDARTYADCNVQSDWTGETTACIIPIMSDGSLGGIIARIVYIDPNDGDDWIDSDDDDDEPTIDYSPSATVSVDAPIESAPVQTTNTSTITRSILETLDNASQGLKGWISMEMNDGRTVCTDGNDVWFADVGNRVQIDSINLTDTFVSIRFPNDGGVMWLYYDEMVNASLTITGAN